MRTDLLAAFVLLFAVAVGVGAVAVWVPLFTFETNSLFGPVWITISAALAALFTLLIRTRLSQDEELPDVDVDPEELSA
jgi:hypothetical protein